MTNCLIFRNLKIEISSTLILSISSFIFSLISILLSVFFTNYLILKEKKETVEKIQRKQELFIKEADELFKNGLFRSALIVMGKLIESALQKELLKKRNVYIDKPSLKMLIDIGLREELINPKTANSIKRIRNLRNQAAHLEIQLKKEDAEKALKETAF